MAPVKRKLSSMSQRARDLDFRSTADDAWHTVRLDKTEDVLRVMYVEFPETQDDFFAANQFERMEKIEELHGRFRNSAEQLQDSQCSWVSGGMTVLAYHKFTDDTLLFYDASVDSVLRSEHKENEITGEEECTCQFNVIWKHGPKKNKNIIVRTKDICLIKDSPSDDSVLMEFIEDARKSLEGRLTQSTSGVLSGHRVSPTGHVPEMEDNVVAMLKAKIAEMEEQARAASTLEKVKSELEMKVEHLEKHCANQALHIKQEKEHYEGMLNYLHGKLAHANDQSQILEGQIQDAKQEREQAIFALHEIEAKLKGEGHQVGKFVMNWQIPEHLNLLPSETVLNTIRYSQAFAPFRQQVEKAIKGNLLTDEESWTARILNRYKLSANIVAPTDAWKIALTHPGEENPEKLAAARGFVTEVHNREKMMRQKEDDNYNNWQWTDDFYLKSPVHQGSLNL